MTISEMRKAAGFSTQEQLATAAHTSRMTIAKMEAGITVPKWRALMRIAAAMNCTVDGLLGVISANADLST